MRISDWSSDVCSSDLLLVSHAPGGLLPTIRSRCRRLALKPLDSGTLSEALERLLPALDAAERRGLAVLAEGSPGRAVTLASQGGLKIGSASCRERVGQDV